MDWHVRHEHLGSLLQQALTPSIACRQVESRYNPGLVSTNLQTAKKTEPDAEGSFSLSVKSWAAAGKSALSLGSITGSLCLTMRSQMLPPVDNGSVATCTACQEYVCAIKEVTVASSTVAPTLT